MQTTRKKHRHEWLTLVSLALATAGCGNGDRPALATVTGVVTLDGKPLTNAHLILQPEAAYRASYALTDESGQYEAVYLRDIKGAVLGKHSVRINRLSPDENKQADPLPPRYNAKTELQIEVEQGSNSIDFELQSQ